MNGLSVPDSWENKREINIDDGGGTSFESGYDLNTLTIEDSTMTVPRAVGCWRINESFHVYVVKRPNRLNRFMTKFLLGWIWVDS